MHQAVPEKRGVFPETEEVVPHAQPARVTILVVEDEPLVRLFTADILRGAGYEIIEAGEATEALTALSSDQRIDLLFSDVLLHGSMGGLTLAESAHANHPNMPVILSSGAGAFGRYLEGRKSVTFLPKPYNADQLLSAVAGMLPATD